MSIEELCNEDQPATLLRQATPGQVDGSGLAIQDLTRVRGIRGHAALNDASQVLEWRAMGIDASYRFATLDLNVKNGDFIRLQDGRLFIVKGIPRRYGKGNIPGFAVIPMNQTFLQGDLD